LLVSIATSESHWKELFDDAYLYIRKILKDNDGNENDVDTIKRAKSIAAREKFESEQQQDNKSFQKPTVVDEVADALEKTAISHKAIETTEQESREALESVAAADPVAISSTEEEDGEEGGEEEEVKKSPRQQPRNKKKSKKNRKTD
jgi:hypothetical protein